MLKLHIYPFYISKRGLRGRSWVIEMAFFCASKKTKSEATCITGTPTDTRCPSYLVLGLLFSPDELHERSEGSLEPSCFKMMSRHLGSDRDTWSSKFEEAYPLL